MYTLPVTSAARERVGRRQRNSFARHSVTSPLSMSPYPGHQFAEGTPGVKEEPFQDVALAASVLRLAATWHVVGCGAANWRCGHCTLVLWYVGRALDHASLCTGLENTNGAPGHHQKGLSARTQNINHRRCGTPPAGRGWLLPCRYDPACACQLIIQLAAGSLW